MANVMPLDFEQRIRDRVYHNMNKGNSKVECITAPYQADPCIAKLATDMKVEFIGSGDSDFPMYVGPGKDGTSDIMLRGLVVK